MSFSVEIIDGNESICCGEFTYTDSIMDIKKYYCNNINNNTSINNTILYYMSQPMNDNKNIEYYDDNINFKFICTLSHKTFGGSEQKYQSKSNKKYKIGVEIKGRKRIISEVHKSRLKITNKSCVIYGDTGTNVIMPCGCVYCPQACFEVGHKIFADNRRNTKIFCQKKCKTEWSFKYWSKAACLYKDEYIVLSSELQKRLSPEIKQCPYCQLPNTKPKEFTERRISCVCKMGPWCWVCGKVWINSGKIVCGNRYCPTAWVNNVLKSCPTKDLGPSYSNVIIPTTRACVKCHTLISHQDRGDAKYMRCPQCRQLFCFKCLKVPDSNNGNTWPCGPYDAKCASEAPRQVL